MTVKKLFFNSTDARASLNGNPPKLLSAALNYCCTVPCDNCSLYNTVPLLQQRLHFGVSKLTVIGKVLRIVSVPQTLPVRTMALWISALFFRCLAGGWGSRSRGKLWTIAQLVGFRRRLINNDSILIRLLKSTFTQMQRRRKSTMRGIC